MNVFALNFLHCYDDCIVMKTTVLFICIHIQELPLSTVEVLKNANSGGDSCINYDTIYSHVWLSCAAIWLHLFQSFIFFTCDSF